MQRQSKKVMALMVALALIPFALLLGNSLGAQTQQGSDLEPDQHKQTLDARQAADLEQKLQRLYARLAPSVVRIYTGAQDPNAWGSGVIVSASGEIFTAGHLDLAPHSHVTVELADGRKVQAIALGHFKEPEDKQRYLPRTFDIGVLRLEGNEKWPAASLGRSAATTPGAFCLAIGYPGVHKPGQPPLLRLGRMLPPDRDGGLRVSCRILPGDSGGPLFDLEGHVLGVLSGMGSLKWADITYAPVESFLKYRDRLLAGDELAELKDRYRYASPHYLWGAFAPTETWAPTLAEAHRSVVQVLGDGKPVALGLIVGADGWIVTKRTELVGYRRLVCQASDGRQWDAEISSGSAPHDLALLKVAATRLPTPRWGKAELPHAGQIVASLGPTAQPLHCGVICASHVLNPAITGYLPINGKPDSGTSGLIFTEVWDRPDNGQVNTLLRPGDRITHLDGIPTPTAEEYVRVRDRQLASPNSLIGERFLLTVQRGQERFDVAVPIVSSAFPHVFDWGQCPLSLRRNGFPTVFVHDGGIPPNQCGGPVADRAGRVLGINIARADAVQTFALPGEVVQKLVADLRAQRKQP